MMWQVIATVHHQNSRWTTRQIKLPPFTLNYAEDEKDAKYQVDKIVNVTNNPSITVISHVRKIE